MSMSDFSSPCPHGNRGPHQQRPCMCALVEVPHSEVAMHMRVAGTMMWVHPVEFTNPGNPRPSMVQLYDLSNRKFSAPVTAGEGGYPRGD
jgi:hypothetical protein